MAVLMCTCGFSCGTRAALNKHWSKFPAGTHGPTEKTKQIFELSEQFTYFDTSGDRSLDLSEMGALLRKGNPFITDKEVRVLFAAADRDHDNMVDFDEFLAHIFSDTDVEAAATEKSVTPVSKPVARQERPGSQESELRKELSFGSLFNGRKAVERSRKTTEASEDPVTEERTRPVTGSRSPPQNQVQKEPSFGALFENRKAVDRSRKNADSSEDPTADERARAPVERRSPASRSRVSDDPEINKDPSFGALFENRKAVERSRKTTDVSEEGTRKASDLSETQENRIRKDKDPRKDSSYSSGSPLSKGLRSPEQTPEPSYVEQSLRPETPGGSKTPKSPSINTPSGSPNRRLNSTVRFLIVRHGRSGNKARKEGEAPSLDPELSELGYEQAEALGKKLASTLKRIQHGDLIIASSPMRRCLLTIRPAIFQLNLAPDDCICHACCYEFGCAGLANSGTPVQQIMTEFPEFAPVGFNPDGSWDYRGSNPRETQDEAKERSKIIVDWIWHVAQQLSQRPSRREKVFVLSFHQTMADLVCQLLVDGTTEEWVYGEMKYKLFNTGITEIILSNDGQARVGPQNDFSHLRELGGPKAQKCLMRSQSDQTAKVIAKMRAEFSKIDTTGDYKLDFHEMSVLLRKGNPGMSEAELWNIFSSVDTTNDGDIDFDEFLTFIFGEGSGTLSF